MIVDIYFTGAQLSPAGFVLGRLDMKLCQSHIYTGRALNVLSLYYLRKSMLWPS